VFLPYCKNLPKPDGAVRRVKFGPTVRGPITPSASPSLKPLSLKSFCASRLPVVTREALKRTLE
jgi:hypothetical protein